MKMIKYVILFLMILVAYYQGMFQSGFAKNKKKISQFIFDAHVHSGLIKENGKITISGLNYFTDRKINAFIFALPVDRSKTDNLLLRITDEMESITYLVKNNRNLTVINNWDSLNFNINEKPSIFFCIEYFDGIFGNKIESIQSFKELGIRYITLINNTKDNLFLENDRLTEFGKSVIKKMNKVDMLIDISRLSESQMLEVTNYSSKPVIASHTAARAIANIEGNSSNAVLNALKRKNGYVMVTFNKEDLLSRCDIQTDGVEQLVRHIDHIRRYIDISHIGIGSDYQAAGKYIPEELNKLDTFVKIAEVMKIHGYTESEISDVFGKNLKRTLIDSAKNSINNGNFNLLRKVDFD